VLFNWDFPVEHEINNNNNNNNNTLPFETKVRGGCELPGADMQKPYAPKFGEEKTKIDLFRDFFYKNHLCPSYQFYSETTTFFRKMLIL
jgi:hypothetical protein